MTDAEREEINNEPVWYCKQCLSLKIMNMGDQCFCDQCGSVDVDKAQIQDWEEMYEQEYKHKFLENGRKRSRYVWAEGARQQGREI